ncbi:MAG: choice-of-anchor T family protein [Thermoplasmatota archaeon]
MRIICRCAAIMMLLSIALMPFAIGEQEVPEAPLAGEPDIEIVLDQDMVEVDVEPGSDGIARFTGTVYCEMPPTTPPGRECVVNLQTDAGGWPVSLPPTMEFNRQHQQEDFTVTVQIPIDTSQSTTGQLAVSGRWIYTPGLGGGTVPVAESIIQPLPYSKVHLTYDKENNTASVGEWGEIEIGVVNEGNARDDIKLEIADLPDGLEAHLEKEILTVREKQTETTVLRFKQSSGSPGSHQIFISAEGQHNGTRSETEQPVVARTTASIRSVVTTPYIVIPIVLVLLIAGIMVVRIIRRKRKVEA